MNESDDFEWLDTKLVNRQMVPLIFIVAVDFGVTIGLLIADIFPVVVLFAVSVTILVVPVLGYYSGGKETRRLAPILVGLSSSRIRLQFFDGHHEDILWEDIDDILLPGFWNPNRVVLKDGGYKTLWAPDKIALKVKNRLQEVRKGSE
jgi:hypothetical protein